MDKKDMTCEMCGSTVFYPYPRIIPARKERRFLWWKIPAREAMIEFSCRFCRTKQTHPKGIVTIGTYLSPWSIKTKCESN